MTKNTLGRVSNQAARQSERVSTMLQQLRARVDNMMAHLGGGEKRVAEMRNLENFAEEHKAIEQAEKVAKNAQERFNRLNKTRSGFLSNAEKHSVRQAELESAFADEAVANLNRNLNAQARRLVANRGYKRLGKLATMGGLGVGAALALSQDSPEQLNQEEQSNYRWTPNNGWEQMNANGMWMPQQEEFGVDRFGNTNFYDSDTGRWYSDYIQGSDGSIYDRQGNLLGNVLPSGGNIFELNKQKVAQALGQNNLSTEDIMALQKGLGVTADGLVGARTLNAMAKSLNSNDYFTRY